MLHWNEEILKDAASNRTILNQVDYFVLPYLETLCFDKTFCAFSLQCFSAKHWPQIAHNQHIDKRLYQIKIDAVGIRL